MPEEDFHPAEWLAALPTDGRGFRVPAEAPWTGQEPEVSAASSERTVALALERCCAICGFPLIVGWPVYRAFGQEDAATIRGQHHEFTHDFGGPGHLSCMLYSALVCPHLRGPTARLAKGSEVNPGAKRGDRAALLGFEDFNLLLPMHGTASNRPLIGYKRLVDDMPYSRGEELIDRYVAAIANEADHFDMVSPRRYWRGSVEDRITLNRIGERLASMTAGSQPELVVAIDGVPHGALAIPSRS